jgi:hypothetical protein
LSDQKYGQTFPINVAFRMSLWSVADFRHRKK